MKTILVASTGYLCHFSAYQQHIYHIIQVYAQAFWHEEQTVYNSQAGKIVGGNICTPDEPIGDLVGEGHAWQNQLMRCKMLNYCDVAIFINIEMLSHCLSTDRP